MTNSSCASPTPRSAAGRRWGEPRPVQADDLEPIRRILIATGAFIEEEVRVAIELVEDALRRPGVDYLVKVIESEEGVAGYTCYGRAPFTEAAYDLYWIALDPIWQGTGAARRLMAATEADIRARGGRLLLVETASKPSYARTRHFYESIGYHEVARIRDYYREGDDKVIYEKRWAAERLEELNVRERAH
jgi:ribosomal protein S18 acetylase RimI-like enzyme